MADLRLRCRFGWHQMRAWSMPEDLQRRLLADCWAWSSLKCIHCDHVKVRMVRVERSDGNTGSLRG